MTTPSTKARGLAYDLQWLAGSERATVALTALLAYIARLERIEAAARERQRLWDEYEAPPLVDRTDAMFQAYLAAKDALRAALASTAEGGDGA